MVQVPLLTWEIVLAALFFLLGFTLDTLLKRFFPISKKFQIHFNFGKFKLLKVLKIAFFVIFALLACFGVYILSCFIL